MGRLTFTFIKNVLLLNLPVLVTVTRVFDKSSVAAIFAASFPNDLAKSIHGAFAGFCEAVNIGALTTPVRLYLLKERKMIFIHIFKKKL